MIKSSIKFPLLCWRCLSKKVILDKDQKVVCLDLDPLDETQKKQCGQVMTKDEWMEKAKGSLPKSGQNQEWTITVEIPEYAVKHLRQ